MARSSSPDITLEFGQGSPLADITQWIVSDIALGDEGIYVDGTAFGMTHVVNLPVGVADQGDVTLEGFFDDDDNGPFDVFGNISGVNTPAYTLKVTWVAGSPTSTSSWPCHIKDFKIMAKVKDVTRFRVILKQAGPIVHVRQGGAV